jgi:hypothetical protein
MVQGLRMTGPFGGLVAPDLLGVCGAAAIGDGPRNLRDVWLRSAVHGHAIVAGLEHHDPSGGHPWPPPGATATPGAASPRDLSKMLPSACSPRPYDAIAKA